MNEKIERGLTVIGQAENSLRVLMQESIESGSYDELAVLAGWAEQLAGIPNGKSAVSRSLQSGPSRHGSDKQAISPPVVPARARRPGKSSRLKKKYPVFERAGDILVKIGWSKASRAEYQHRSPKSVALELFEKMQRLSRDRDLITMDEVLPMRLAGDDTDVAAYQSYVCLAWLRSIGAVKQHGRQGYSVVAKGDWRSVIDRGWSELGLHHA